MTVTENNKRRSAVIFIRNARPRATLRVHARFCPLCPLGTGYLEEFAVLVEPRPRSPWRAEARCRQHYTDADMAKATVEFVCAACGLRAHMPPWMAQQVLAVGEDRSHWTCSPRCYARQRRAELRHNKSNTCSICGETFETTRTDARFCSNACRQRGYRRRQAWTKQVRDLSHIDPCVTVSVQETAAAQGEVRTTDDPDRTPPNQASPMV